MAQKREAVSVNYKPFTRFAEATDKYYYKDGTTSSKQDNTKVLHREDGPAAEWANGDKGWFVDGKLHRTDGPAIEWTNGDRYWFVDGKRHRIDGPAIEFTDGRKDWYIDGKRHREDGPAVENANGDKFWYINDNLHREDGPAAEWANGAPGWWMDEIQLQDPIKTGIPLKVQYEKLSKERKPYKDLIETQNIEPYKYTGPSRLWVQMAENAIELHDVSLKGEVCVTPFGTGEKVFRETEGHIGYVWKGKPSYYFPFDVYSEINEQGKRQIDWDQIEYNTNQEEAWLDPSKSQLIGLVYVTEESTLEKFIENDPEGVEFLLSHPGKKSFLRLPSGQTQEVTGEQLKSDKELEHDELERKVANFDLQDLVTSSIDKTTENLEKYGCAIVYSKHNKNYTLISKGAQDFKFDSLFQIPKLTPKNPALKEIIHRLIDKQKTHKERPLRYPTEQTKDYQPFTRPIDYDTDLSTSIPENTSGSGIVG